MPNIPISSYTNFVEHHFLCKFPGSFSDYNNILITMKNDAVLNLSTFK